MSGKRGRWPGTPSPDQPADGQLTSDDLFGDLVDGAAPTPAGGGATGRRPIRIHLADPTRRASGSAAVRPSEHEEAEIEDLLARLEPPKAEAQSAAAGSGNEANRVTGRLTDPGLEVADAGAARLGSRGSFPAAFGPYTLLERIAIGGMAEVFKAKRRGVEGFEKVVALKRILPHLSDNKEFVDMFVNEAKMVAGLAHPNIVQIYDLGRIERSYYIAMEYVHGRDLRTIARRAQEKKLRLPLDLGLRVVSSVCAALEYAHRKKDDRGRAMEIVHRDVSPQNILISFEGDVKLADFGIARAASKAPSTDRGALRGKIPYMSPEQASGRRLDRRSDIFSLGIVLYEMATETKPFVSAGPESALELVRQGAIAPPREVNPRIGEALDHAIRKALAREPDERYQDAASMQRGLERCLRERPPVTSRDLARLLELLFDRSEREGGGVPGQRPADPDQADGREDS